LSRAKVTSPIAGSVVKRLVSVGEQVDGTAGQPLLEVANLEVLELGANVPAEHLGAVRPGQAVQITSDAYPSQSFPGSVVAVAPAVDPATNTALARVRVLQGGRLQLYLLYVLATLIALLAWQLVLSP